MRDISGLVQRATSQHGLLTTIQLRELGCSRAATETLVRRGVLTRIRPGVVRVSGSPLTWEQRLLAVSLSTRSRVVASHHSALRLLGLRRRFSGLEGTVRYPADCRLGGVRIHRSTNLEPEQIQPIDGIPATSAARTLVDVSSTLPPRELGRIVDHAIAIGLVELEELVELRQRIGGAGVHGLRRLDAVLERGSAHAGADSGPEVALRRALVTAGLPAPTPQVEVVVRGCRYRVDLAYPAIGLAIEYDGYRAHAGLARFEDDRQRQNDLVASGWRILRFTARDLREGVPEIVALVRAELERTAPNRSGE